ncbi:hypothetical protein EWM64_g3316 [Hericium alpestre]|uniref:Potassium transport protein n=1 Tax=Hericium alpestre TaxID=135208 RepID=A0A4Z0A386_9AGAM|nr:hypothetical protein EWM64_g3316 [Hericium alpestre]
MPRTRTIASQYGPPSAGARVVPYISFDAVVGRNSVFQHLTNEQIEELGGVEFRALTALLWIVAGRAYPMIVVMIFLILAGNTGFPVFLRFFIWVFAKLVPTRSRVHETFHFLLDHPRRCFIYLFPSHQTWFLLTILLILNGTDWVGFLVLDIGTPVVEALPRGVRVLDGLLQAAAVRSSGFAIVTLSAIAPGTKVLYVIMMYISVYPIAMSVRSTNVYEEKSLGIYTHDGDDEEDRFTTSGGRMTVWSRYLSMHMRRQLAFDMWWLCLALLLVCIVERGNLINPDNQSWFTVFNILFEIVSAYGTVGMSLGVPYANYSLSGAFSPLSKLIVCIVMLRGRHRGLPVAIDRAVMLPFEFRRDVEEVDDHSPAATRRRSRSFLRVPTVSTGHNVGVPSPSQSEKPGEPGRPERPAPAVAMDITHAHTGDAEWQRGRQCAPTALYPHYLGVTRTT